MAPAMTEIAEEMAAMGSIAATLDPLDESARGRVLAWVNDRFGCKKSHSQPTHAERGGNENLGTEKASDGFASLADLFDAAAAETDKDKALVAAYWESGSEGVTFTAQSLNSQLKHLGHGVGNITRALDQLAAEKPALILQVRKAGSSQQARKLFKVTEAGRKRIKFLVQKGASEER